MQGVKKLNVEFRNKPRHSLNFTQDVTKYPVIKFMSKIMLMYVVTESSLFTKWQFFINEVLIDTEFKAKTLSLKQLGIISEPVLLRVYYKEDELTNEQAQEGRRYNLNAKLKKTMKENETLFKTNLETNGMVSGEIYHVMGHFQSKLRELELKLSMDQIYFNMDFQFQNSPVHIIGSSSKSKLSFSPYLTPGHVALLCVFDNGRVCHIDPSGSVSFNNVSILQKNLKNVSFTYLNYQYLENEKSKDEINGDYASGNCAIFMCLNLLRFVIHYEEYKKPMGFNVFWEKLIEVSDNSNLESSIKLIQRLFVNIMYMHLTENGQSKEDYCRSVSQIQYEFDIPDSLPELRQQIQFVSKDVDFTADCVILDLFIASEMGFHEITKFGNKLRELVRQMTVFGFIDQYFKY
jgi:hypothetical protein